METMYHFEAHRPPPCSEALLRRRLEQRRRRQMAVLLAVAGILLQAAGVLLGLLLWPDVPVLAAALLLYPLLAAAGRGTIATVYAQKEVRA